MVYSGKYIILDLDTNFFFETGENQKARELRFFFYIVYWILCRYLDEQLLFFQVNFKAYYLLIFSPFFTELPDTSFTRSISNPEAVMRRRRQQKLEKKLQQFRSRDGGMYYLELFANLKPHVFSIPLFLLLKNLKS